MYLLNSRVKFRTVRVGSHTIGGMAKSFDNRRDDHDDREGPRRRHVASKVTELKFTPYNEVSVSCYPNCSPNSLLHPLLWDWQRSGTGLETGTDAGPRTGVSDHQSSIAPSTRGEETDAHQSVQDIRLADETIDNKDVVSISDVEQEVEMTEVIEGSHILRPSADIRRDIVL